MRINVTRSSMPSFEEYCEEIRELWDSRWLTNMGVKHCELEAGLREYLGVPSLTLFTNGHLALEGIISAMGFERGAEVITTPFTFVSTVNAIKRCGLVPVFCEIDPYTLTMDPSSIEPLITDKTRAILPVHVYGTLCDHEAIAELASAHGLKVIYDAAHAFGVTVNGKSAAALGDASMFSFHATKVFHTVEGGAVCCDDPELAAKMTVMKNFGLDATGDCVEAGTNAKMSEFHAAMGICNLRHIDAEIEKRRLAAELYRERLSKIDGIRLVPVQNGVKSNYAYMPVIFDRFKKSRDEIHELLKEQSILSRKYFYPAINDMSAYKSSGYPTPIASDVASKVLCLPLYADISADEVNEICELIIDN